MDIFITVVDLIVHVFSESSKIEPFWIHDTILAGTCNMIQVILG